MNKLIIILVLSVFITSCEDIIGVEDISGNTVSILAPADNATLTNSTVTFSWNSVLDAESYRIQIALPDFENATQILVDSSVTSTLFQKTLSSGMYEWRIRAENSDFQTSYTTQSFTVSTETIDISNETVTLLAPADNVIFNTTSSIQFSWEAIPDADTYTFQIATPDFDNAIEIIEDEILTATNFSLSNLDANNYEWRVKGNNESYSTAYSTNSFSVEE